MEAPGYGEEEEPINTILGKVLSVNICCIITRDGALKNHFLYVCHMGLATALPLGLTSRS